MPPSGGGWESGAPDNGLYGPYGEAPLERCTFFRLQVYKNSGFHKSGFMRGQRSLPFSYLEGPLNQNISNRRTLWLYHLIF